MIPNGNVSGCVLPLQDYKSQGARGDPYSPSPPGPASLQPESRRLTCSRRLPRPVLRSPQPEPEPEEVPRCQDLPRIREFHPPGVQRLWRRPTLRPWEDWEGTRMPSPRAELGVRRCQGPSKKRTHIYWTKGKGTLMPELLGWRARTPWSRGDAGAGTPESHELGALRSLSL